MDPKIVVLHGGPSLDRARNLIRAMVNSPPNLDGFGGVMVALMTLPPSASKSEQADLIQPFLRQFTLKDDEDPGFDERIMYEALLFTANQFRQAWKQQVPNLSYEGFQFSRWLGTDLQLERR